MLYLFTHRATVCLTFAVVALATPSPLFATTSTQTPADSSLVTIEEFSPAFLGIYRKVMKIEDEISKHARTYDIDLDLAWAV